MGFLGRDGTSPTEKPLGERTKTPQELRFGKDRAAARDERDRREDEGRRRTALAGIAYFRPGTTGRIAPPPSIPCEDGVDVRVMRAT